MAYRMTRLFALVAACSLFSSVAMAAAQVGQPAPDFTGTDAISGKSVTLSELKGKRVVLEWHNEECPFVKKFYSVGAMQHLQDNASRDDVVWITVNSSASGKQGYYADDAEVRDFLGKRNAQPTYYLRDPSGSIGKQYDARTTPHMFVIDEKGVLAYMGAIDDTPTADSADIATAKNYVTRTLESLDKGAAVKVSSTRPYGCGVKYN